MGGAFLCGTHRRHLLGGPLSAVFAGMLSLTWKDGQVVWRVV
jgi:hypothetical protein